MSETVEREYRDTLLLGNTAFPMRAELPKREPARIELLDRGPQCMAIHLAPLRDGTLPGGTFFSHSSTAFSRCFSGAEGS